MRIFLLAVFAVYVAFVWTTPASERGQRKLLQRGPPESDPPDSNRPADREVEREPDEITDARYMACLGWWVCSVSSNHLGFITGWTHEMIVLVLARP